MFEHLTMKIIIIHKLLLFSLFATGWCGIVVPRNHCTWLSGHYGNELKCDGDQVVVGACGGGHNADCDPGYYVQMLCCSLPMFYYSNCEKFGVHHGVEGSCLDHGDSPLMLEGTCGSASKEDCDGFSVVNDCCEGHMTSGENVGPQVGQCGWSYANHGQKLECSRSDEIVAGRCGSGENRDCPNDTSHGIFCCELVVL